MGMFGAAVSIGKEGKDAINSFARGWGEILGRCSFIRS